MKLLNLTIIRICLVLIFGILCGFYFNISPTATFAGLGLFFFLFLWAFLKSRTSLYPEIYFGICAYLLFFALGTSSAVINKPENQDRHYKNIAEDIRENSIPLARLRIKERLKPSSFNERYIAEVEALNYKTPDAESSYLVSTQGKILLNIQKDSSSREYFAGNLLTVPFTIAEIPEPLNPYQFDYKAYMSKLGVERQLQISPAQLQLAKTNKTDLIAGFRKHIITDLRNQDFSTDEMAIIQALLLGQRQEISRQVYEDYAAAGAIHILAVSGLHVGILLIILNFLLSPLNRTRHTRTIKTLLLLISLWAFAALAGFSASVVRAVAMFSFIAIGMQLNRRTSLMNSLFTSLFILLLINPHYIFQAGFQLSYLAVFSIIVFYKPIRSLYSPRFKFDRYIRDLLAVSISAQIGVLPLSLFYFHQFPGLFFITNLVILPLLGIILGFGILVIFLGLLGALPPFLAEIFGKVISSMNSFISLVAHQENFLFSEIHFSELKLVSAYLVILVLFIWLYKKSVLNLKLLLLSLIFLQLIFITGKFKNTSEAIIFHQSRESLIGIKEEKQLVLYKSDPESSVSYNSVRDYKQAQDIKSNHTEGLKDVFVFEEKVLLIVDSTGHYQKTGISPELVLLRDSPRINLERLIATLKPEKIIADGSNYRSYVNRWKATCKKEKIPFHHTGEKGAFYILKGQ